ncbi:hypothetical protein Aperf_G00000061453 [Anoplocephala perfoliata]
MWFKIHRRKVVSVRPATTTVTPRKAATKSSKKSAKRFHWPNLHRSAQHQRRKLAPIAAGTPPRNRAALPPPPAPVIDPVPRRIRCGTAIIPIMRASALNLPPLPSTPTIAVKRRPSSGSPSLEDHLQKVRRLSRGRRYPAVEHFNLVYDDVYSNATSEDEAVYEEIMPPRKRSFLISGSNLDLMQVSAMVMDDSPLKRVKSESPDASSLGIYALHGGDWISVASGVYDDVASSGSETDEEFETDAGIYGWAGIGNIPWTMVAFRRSAPFLEARGDPPALQWLCREPYIIR